MPKRKQIKAAPAIMPTESMTPLRKALSRCTKAKLVDVLVELAETDHRILRQITARFDVVVPPAEIVAATRRAIIDATAFDKRDMNRNFPYDYAAYDEVKRNLGQLVGAGQYLLAMELSLELMKRGSCQVEMSDEGLMTPDIQDCLSVVFESLRKCDLPAHKLIAWCSAMLDSDRVKFIATKALSNDWRSAFSASASMAVIAW